MKKPIVLLISWIIYSVSYCQTNINYSSFDAWRQNPSTKKMEHIKSFYESGYIEIDNKKATAIIHNSKTNQGRQALKSTTDRAGKPWQSRHRAGRPWICNCQGWPALDMSWPGLAGPGYGMARAGWPWLIPWPVPADPV